MSDYKENSYEIEKALALGCEEEFLNTLTDWQRHRIAAWLASEGIGKVCT